MKVNQYVLAFLFLLLLPASLFPASINVEELTIISDGKFDATDNKFKFNTYFRFITSFDGGYKFAARVSFETNTTELEYNYYTTTTLGLIYLFFHDAEVTAKNLVDQHFDLSFWTGTHRYLGEGNVYKGYIHYPESVNEDYRGFYRQRGTGITWNLRFWEDKFNTSLHLYHNSNFVGIGDTTSDMNLNYISADAEVGLHFDKVRFDLFGGWTKDLIIAHFPDGEPDLLYGRGKVGFSFWIGEDRINFFTSVGIPNLDVNTFDEILDGTTSFFDVLYLVGELNFKLFLSVNTLSFITKPALFNERATGEKTDFDINYKFQVDVPEYPLTGGFLVNFTYSMKDTSDLWSLTAAPYLAITLSGVIWDFSFHYDFSRISMAQQTGNNLVALNGVRFIIGVSSKF